MDKPYFPIQFLAFCARWNYQPTVKSLALWWNGYKTLFFADAFEENAIETTIEFYYHIDQQEGVQT